MNYITHRMQVILILMAVTFSALTTAAGQNKSPVAPTEQAYAKILKEAYENFKNDSSGKNADYIPALAQVDSKLYGISIVTTDGRAYKIGDVDKAFSIQSISKVYTLALAMQELGADVVFKKIGSEPTGRAFNSIPAVVDMPTHAGNPYVNAGAIATASLISGASAEDKWNNLLAFFDKAAGTKLSLLDDVYKSEAATNTGNKAISMLLAKYDRIYADPFDSVDVYTKACSVGVTANQLAVMGATLANNGKNPVTGEQVISPENVPHILSAMMMAGLYDGSGGWAWNVGIPAKSGVGGGIIAVVPGKGAMAVFAPPLDEAGNSVKAQKAIAYVADKLGINIFSPASVGLK